MDGQPPTGVPAAALNAFRLINCTICGAVLGAVTGGGIITGGDLPEELLARTDLHAAWHRRNDRD